MFPQSSNRTHCFLYPMSIEFPQISWKSKLITYIYLPSAFAIIRKIDFLTAKELFQTRLIEIFLDATKYSQNLEVPKLFLQTLTSSFDIRVHRNYAREDLEPKYKTEGKGEILIREIPVFNTKLFNRCINNIVSRAFKFGMSEDLVKLRGRLSSQAMTAAQQLPENDASSISFKPKEDPDAPPALQLEEDFDIFCDSQEPKLTQDKESFELSPPRRLRTKSEDNEYTILGFLERKIRIRIMSEQFNEKVILTNK